MLGRSPGTKTPEERSHQRPKHRPHTNTARTGDNDVLVLVHFHPAVVHGLRALVGALLGGGLGLGLLGGLLPAPPG